MERTSEERMVGGLTHLAILLNWVGLIVNVVLYVVYRPKSSYVTHHVKQALGLQLISIVVVAILGLVAGVGSVSALGSVGKYGGKALLGSMFMGIGSTALIGLITLVMAVIAAVKGFQGTEYRHPLFGEFVARLG